jgi:C_GCAxxG_C_C family probable redox protein
MDRVHTAVFRFQEGCSCSQAVLSTYGPMYGLSEETALKIAAGFGGGMGRMGGTCGAVIGAFMVLGLKYGPAAAEDDTAKEKTYELVREFSARFKGRHRSLLCQDLLRCDISSPEGYQQAKDQKLFSAICRPLVQDAAEILEQLLSE